VSVSINGFSFKHVDYLERVSLNLPPSPLDNSLELKRLMSESVIQICIMKYPYCTQH
jgi:hypothetical protein